MPIVRIPDPIFERLQAIATPLIDTPASVIEKLLNFYDSQGKQARPMSAAPVDAKRDDACGFDPDRPPNLTHTRVLAAQFDGQQASGWNELVHLAHRRALSRLGSFGALRSATLSNITQGQRKDSGFQYLSDIGVSIQNVSSQEAWLKVLNLARRLNAAVQVDFEWRQKPGAARPGKSGSLSWQPSGTQPKT